MLQPAAWQNAERERTCELQVTLPRDWRPRALRDQIRVGARYDGGYVLPQRALAATRVLLSLGINDEWTFEREFCRRNPAVRLVAFDGSVTSKFWINHIADHIYSILFRCNFRRIPRLIDGLRFKWFFSRAGREFRPKWIGYTASGRKTLAAVLAELPFEALFLKIDIEGWEYRILDQIAASRSRLTGMVIEFHDVDLMRDRISAFFERMRPHFLVTHLHGNNFGGVNESHDPLVIEVTLLNRELCDAEELAGEPAAPCGHLDAPNDRSKPDLSLEYAG